MNISEATYIKDLILEREDLLSIIRKIDTHLNENKICKCLLNPVGTQIYPVQLSTVTLNAQEYKECLKMIKDRHEDRIHNIDNELKEIQIK